MEPAPRGGGEKKAGTAIDPVCKMVTDPASAAATPDCTGTTYYFCAPGCKKIFDKNLSKYLSGKAAR